MRETHDTNPFFLLLILCPNRPRSSENKKAEKMLIIMIQIRQVLLYDSLYNPSKFANDTK